MLRILGSFLKRYTMDYYSCLVLLLALFNSNALQFQSKNGTLPNKDECGLESSSKFPWVAFIPAQSRVFNPSANIRCAGALISKRYVILNRSCFQFYLTKVHLGQDDIDKVDEILKLDISEKLSNDIYDVVLVRLSEDVKFSDKIRPICLPFDDFKKPVVGDTVYSSGWGLERVEGPSSKIKKVVKETLEGDCGVKKDKLRIKDPICVKVQESNADKACNGDEGSPIMYKDGNRWILQGVLIDLFDSSSKPCVGDEPAVGAKITEEILQWIIEKVY